MIAVLADGDFVVARREQQLFLAFVFLDVARIFAVNPHAGIPLILEGSRKADFASGLVLLRMRGGHPEK